MFLIGVTAENAGICKRFTTKFSSKTFNNVCLGALDVFNVRRAPVISVKAILAKPFDAIVMLLIGSYV